MGGGLVGLDRRNRRTGETMGRLTVFLTGERENRRDRGKDVPSARVKVDFDGRTGENM